MGYDNRNHVLGPSPSLEKVFVRNLKMGVPFRDCFMLILSLSGHTQASLMRCVNRTQSELSQYLNGHRGIDAPVRGDVKQACREQLGFNPWAAAKAASDKTTTCEGCHHDSK